MGRYSPTVVPQVPDPLDVVQSMWSGYLGHKQSERAEKGVEQAERGLDIREKEADARAESVELDRHRQGYRRGRAPGRVPDESIPPMLRSGAKVTGPPNQPAGIGLQPEEREGLPALRDQLSEAKRQYDPEIIAKPGALIPGQNVFADRAITSQELQMEPDPRYEQVNEEWYYDPESSPDARMLDRQIGYDEARQGLQEQIEQRELASREKALIAAGVDPAEARVEAYNMDIPGRKTTSGSRPLDAFTMPQAVAYLKQRHAKWEPNELTMEMEFAGYNEGWDEERILMEARKLAVGDYSESQPMDEGSRGGVVGGEFLDYEGIPFGEYLDRYRTDPFGVRGGDAPGPEIETPPADPVMTDAEVAEARQLISDLDPEEARLELVELGLTTADIERIIGG